MQYSLKFLRTKIFQDGIISLKTNFGDESLVDIIASSYVLYSGSYHMDVSYNEWT